MPKVSDVMLNRYHPMPASIWVECASRNAISSRLAPAIAIEQKVISRNPRSTVGTTTEIYEYLRLLFARIGHTFSPISGNEVKMHTVEDVIECTRQYSEGTKFAVLSPLTLVKDATSLLNFLRR